MAEDSAPSKAPVPTNVFEMTTEHPNPATDEHAPADEIDEIT